MKFSEKLTNLRKQNNKSQEQLADKLGVSRQAVSKWESGISVPDMEKMMQLCKILNCNLEDLVDDGIGGSKKQTFDLKPNWNTYYKEVIDFITKTLNMFWSMRLVEKIKCILEMFFLAVILFLVWGIIGNIIHSSFFSILTLLPDTIHHILRSISSFIYQIFGIIAGFILLVHIFKIRYLDYFITIEDPDITEKSIETPIEEQETKKIEENKRQFIEKKKNKIIIRDAKHSTYSFFGILAKFVVWAIKFLFILFAIPCIICFIGITFLAFCSLWYMKNGIFFLGVFLAILGALLINYLVIKIIYYFVFELKQTFQKIFIMSIIGLTLMGVGGSIAFCTYLNFDKVSINNQEQTTTTHEIAYEDKMVLELLIYDNVTIVEDNSLSNIKIDIKHNKAAESHIYSNQHYTSIMNEVGEYISTTYNVYSLQFGYDGIDGIDTMNYLIQMIKDKERFDLSKDNASYEITITTSKSILDKLEKNNQNFYK